MGQAPAAMSPTECINKYAHFLSLTKSVEFEFSETREQSGGGESDNWRWVTQGLCKHDGRRWKVIYDGSLELFQKGKWTKSPSNLDYVVPAEGVLQVEDEGSGYTFTAMLKNPRDGSREGWLQIQTLCFLFGRSFGDSGFIVDLFRQSKATVDEDTKDGVSVLRLSASTPTGRYQMWLDPTKDFAPTRFEVRKSGNEIVGGAETSAAETMTSFNYLIDDLQCQLVEDVYVISGFRSAVTKTYGSGKTLVDSGVLSLSNVRPRASFSDEDFQLTRPVPEGHRVIVHDAPNIPHEWRGGKVVKSVNRSVLESIEGHEYAGVLGTGMSPGVLLFSCSNIALFFALGWWYLRQSPK